MKKRIQHFTLVEMLTVVAIIGILAGLIIPTVVIAQRRGRETQAKSDISSIMTALKQLKSDYNRILVKDSGKFYIGGKEAAKTTTFNCAVCSGSSHNVVCLGNPDPSSMAEYNALIAELSVPKNGGLPSSLSHRVNKRKKTYLDPKNGFDPAANYDKAENPNNLEKLWRDPWGNAYIIYIGTDTDHALGLPDTRTSTSDNSEKKIASGIAIYSMGPNGEDDKGCNASLDMCIIKNDQKQKNHKNHDDIASWNL